MSIAGLPGEHPVEEEPHLVDVALLARVAGGQNLRRHDGVVNDVRADGRRAAELVADAEVADLHHRAIGRVGDEDVARVKVVVDDVVVVEELHRGEELPRELEDEPLLHRRAEHCRERVIAALEREVEEVPLLEGVVDVDDVRVA